MMTKYRNGFAIAFMASGIALAAIPAQAGTRAGDKQTVYPVAPQGAHGGNQTVGPKQGFPDNHGMERAYERADEHAAFKRGKSGGT